MSMYEQPAQAQFINTYVPIPFQEIVQAASMRQGRHDTQRALLEQQLAEAEMYNSIPGADREYIEKVQRTLKETAEEFSKADFSNPEVIREIYSNRIKPNVNKKWVNDIQKTYQAVGEYQKSVVNLDTPQELIEDFSDYNSREKGAFSGVPEKGYNRRAKKESYFNDIQTNIYTDPETGMISEYVDQNDLNRLTIAATDDYMRSNEGIQDIKIFRKNTGISEKDMSNKEIVQKLLLDAAEEQKVFKNRIIQSGRAKSESQTNLPLNTLEGPSLDILVDSPYKKVKNIKFTSEGDIKEPGEASKEWDLFVNDFKKDFGIKSEGVSKFKRNTELVKELQSTYPNLKYLSAEEAVNAYLTAIEDQSSQSLTSTILPENIAEQVSNVLTNSIGSRSLQIIDKYGRTKVDSKEVFDKLGMKGEAELIEYITKNNKLPISFTQDADTPGMFIYQIADKKGRLRDVLVQSGKEVQAATLFSLKINEAKRTMKPSTVPLMDGNGIQKTHQGIPLAIRVEPDISKEGKTSFRMRNGYFVPFDEKDLQELGRPGTEIIETEQGKYIFVPLEDLSEDKIREMEMLSITRALAIPAAEKESIGTVVPYPR